ncbi:MULTISPECIES: glycoside hydrolase family 125 protein [unclassified Actinotalea]|uniref:glycoside hydrolase family 125 protein n=1 Tax=unclassified Actinotalea TaxID=2638618 RepID=UPI0021054AA4|nr:MULTISPECIES: glycoside hydrolase family 125 protein [unclassified Actinotalea]
MTVLDPATRDRMVSLVRAAWPDPVVERIFTDAMTRTLRDAVRTASDGTTFVLTGDIPAMWLRDSAAQMRPYLPFTAEDPGLRDVVVGLVRQQAAAILRDPYANAVNARPDGAGHQDDLTEMSAWVWERKYEIDSLCFPLQLAHQLWALTGTTDHVDTTFARAARLVVDTLRVEQDHEARSPYRFRRLTGPASDTLVRDGRGNPVAPTGMSWSAFRPSDDACALNYNVPGNLFAAAALTQLATLARRVLGDDVLAADAEALAGQIRAAVARHGVVEHPVHGRIYAYEVDGLGNAVLMDDANMPSLLSLPLTGGVDPSDPLYLATRAFVLSPANPTYVRGRAASGVGSQHTPAGFVWPMALCVEGLTSPAVDVKRALVATLCSTHAGTYRMHESFHGDEPAVHTRDWFSWADSMFCELVLDVAGVRLP